MKGDPCNTDVQKCTTSDTDKMINKPDWTDVHYFLEVARNGKLSLAAGRLNVEHSTVSRRIDRLEKQLDVILFDRHRNGYALTDAGSALVPHAEAMEEALLGAMDETLWQGNNISGMVRVGALEGFGVHVLSPRLMNLASQYPQLSVELMVQTQLTSLITREVEILVTVDPPKIGRYKVMRLTDMNYYLYASRNYLENHARIHTPNDLAGHNFIDYVHSSSVSEQFRFLEEVTSSPKRVFSCTSILAQREAAAAGMGLVLLTPYSAVTEGNRLTNIFPGQPQVTRSLWITAPEDLLRTRRVRLVWDYIVDIVQASPQLFSID
jgi:DNA-binding transcriptional LysR family regulator